MLLQWLTIVMFCYGLLFGSFLNVVGYRLPRGESVAFPPSHCPHCNRRLRAFELIPVVSWIFLRGQCRTCKSGISLRYPLIETITGLLFAVSSMQPKLSLSIVAWLGFWLLLVAAMACDMNAMRIPNVLTYSGFIITFFLAVVFHVQTWSHALLGAAVCFFVILLINLISGGKMGLGDAKLYLSIGSMLGPEYGLLSLVFAAAFGSVIGIFLRFISLLGKKEPVPFVPYICIGAVLAAYYGQPFVQWYLNLILYHS